MNIYDRIDGVLKITDIPFYDTMPTFAEDDEPNLYIVYSLYETPNFYGDGELINSEYTVTVNIFGTDIKKVDDLQMSLSALLQEYGFVYGGCNYQITSDYPRQYRRITDFKIYI